MANGWSAVCVLWQLCSMAQGKSKPGNLVERNFKASGFLNKIAGDRKHDKEGREQEGFL